MQNIIFLPTYLQGSHGKNYLCCVLNYRDIIIFHFTIIVYWCFHILYIYYTYTYYINIKYIHSILYVLNIKLKYTSVLYLINATSMNVLIFKFKQMITFNYNSIDLFQIYFFKINYL